MSASKILNGKSKIQDPIIHSNNHACDKYLTKNNSMEIAAEMYFVRRQPDYIKDHKVFNTIVVPMAMYIDTICTCAQSLVTNTDIEIHNLRVLKPLVAESEETLLLTRFLKTSKNTYDVLIMGKRESDSNFYEVHAKAVLLVNKQINDTNESINLCQEMRGMTELVINDLYQSFSESGIDYGNSFRCIVLAKKTENTCIGLLARKYQLYDNQQHSYTHPTLLDSGFQLLGSIKPFSEETTNYLPVSVDVIKIFSRLDQGVICKAAISPTKQKHRLLTANLTYIDNDTLKECVQIEGMRLLRMQQGSFAKAVTK